jgi:hypothetical protein
MSGRDTVSKLLARGFKLVFWPDAGAAKGPSGLAAKGWLERAIAGQYTLDKYNEGDRVGILHGVELAPGKTIVDVDIDYGPGVEIAKAMLPVTQFIWGRTSKRISHCLYTTGDVVPMFAFKDIGKDGRTLIEFRSDPHQSMSPPSVWEKDGKREPLTFIMDGELGHIDKCSVLKHRVMLAAIGMLLGIHLGKNGFGHEPRLAWAGFLLRAGLSEEDLKTMGLALSKFCNNMEVDDVARVIASTRTNLANDAKKVKGGPALAKLIGENGKAVIARINEWIGRDEDFIRVDGKIVAKNQENIRRSIELLGYELSYDQFSEKKLINGRPMEDNEVTHVYFQIDQEHHYMPPWEFFKQKIEHLAWQNSFHPVKDYLRSLEWDGVPRVDEWLITCAGVEDSKYTRAVSSIMLIAAVRRIYHPGAKYDEMVVWESPQGIGKSSAAQALCPNPAWFADDLPLNVESKVLIEKTLGKWIIEISELAGRKKAEQDHLKAMLSRQVDGPARMAYAHFPVERPRHFILIGTTNPTSNGYLSDATGARRWWPLKIEKFDVEWIKANRDQLWAEAVVREHRGESIRLDEELWPVAAEHQEARREIDPWEHIIRETLLAMEPGTGGRRRITTEAIWTAIAIPIERRDRYAQLRISEIMHRLGFKRTTVRISGSGPQVGFIQEDLHKFEDLEAEDSEDAPIMPDAPF